MNPNLCQNLCGLGNKKIDIVSKFWYPDSRKNLAADRTICGKEKTMFELSVTLAGNNTKTTKKYKLTATDYAGADAQRADILGALAGVTDAKIWSHRLAEVIETADNNNFAPAGVEVENIASVSGQTTVGHKTVLYIPAPKPAIFLGTAGDSAKVVDINNAALQTYVTALSNDTTVSDGETLDYIISGKRIHRKNKRG